MYAEIGTKHRILGVLNELNILVVVSLSSFVMMLLMERKIACNGLNNLYNSHKARFKFQSAQNLLFQALKDLRCPNTKL